MVLLGFNYSLSSSWYPVTRILLVFTRILLCFYYSPLSWWDTFSRILFVLNLVFPRILFVFYDFARFSKPVPGPGRASQSLAELGRAWQRSGIVFRKVANAFTRSHLFSNALLPCLTLLDLFQKCWNAAPPAPPAPPAPSAPRIRASRSHARQVTGSACSALDVTFL